MVNLLGFEESESDYQEKRDRNLGIHNSFIHWYGKTSRPGRKLGHVTVILDGKRISQAKSVIEKIESILVLRIVYKLRSLEINYSETSEYSIDFEQFLWLNIINFLAPQLANSPEVEEKIVDNYPKTWVL